MSGSERRAFQAAMTLKYCQGNACLAERVFGWGRDTVQLGLNEHRAGIICQGAQAACSGDKLWEEKHPIAELSALPQQVQSDRTLLGNFGAALEWRQAGDCRNHAGMGKKHDLERDTADGLALARLFTIKEFHCPRWRCGRLKPDWSATHSCPNGTS